MKKKFIFKIRMLIFELLYPVQLFISWLAIPEPLAEGEWAELAQATLEPGDILTSYNRLHFSNITIEGFYNHAAIYIGRGLVVEAEPKPGVRSISLVKWIMTKDAVFAGRPLYVPFWERQIAANRAESFVGLKYDRGFAWGNKKQYCSETVIQSYSDTLWAERFQEKDAFGMRFILPQHLRNAAEGPEAIVEKLFEFIPAKVKKG